MNFQLSRSKMVCPKMIGKVDASGYSHSASKSPKVSESGCSGCVFTFRAPHQLLVPCSELSCCWVAWLLNLELTLALIFGPKVDEKSTQIHSESISLLSLDALVNFGFSTLC